MGRVIVFNNISLDGYFVDMKGEMSWAHRGAQDEEWNDFVAGNARGGGVLAFGRITYDLMAGYWPSPMAAKNDPVVAERMNALPKIVFSRTMKAATWVNTRLVTTDPAQEIRRLKKGSDGVAIMGSGTIVSLLAQEGLVDEFQFVMIPVVLGKGRTMFDAIRDRLDMKLTGTRSFRNGNVFLTYEPVKGK